MVHCEHLAVTLHTTRRQKHGLCNECSEGYLIPEMEQIVSKLRKSIKPESCMFIQCPGSYHGQLRNRCLHTIDVRQLHIHAESLLSAKQNYILSVTQTPYTHPCQTRTCLNIVVSNGTSTDVSCESCGIEWCTKCLVQPFHRGMSCYDYALSQDLTENGKFIRQMIDEGTFKKCPVCTVVTAKEKDPVTGLETGCNKIICSECTTKWCWLCNESGIDYSHFNSQGSNPCANMLWKGTQ